MPSAAPSRPPTATAAKPTVSDTRAPQITRESTSRPRWSVPSTWALPSMPWSVGAASRPRSDWRSGSCGASHGAATAIRASASTKRPPAMTSRRVRRAPAPPRAAAASTATASTGTDAGIEDAIQEVDGEVEDDEQDGREEDRALHDRVVAVVDRLDGQPSDAGPREDRLRHHGAAEQGAELQPGDRHHRQRGVLERVLHHHAGLRQALGPRGAHEVLAQHIENGRAGKPR